MNAWKHPQVGTATERPIQRRILGAGARLIRIRWDPVRLGSEPPVLRLRSEGGIEGARVGNRPETIVLDDPVVFPDSSAAVEQEESVPPLLVLYAVPGPLRARS